MPLSILIEGPNAATAGDKIITEIPNAKKVEQEGNTRGLLSIATVVAIFSAVGAGAKMVKEMVDAGKSIAEFAKFLTDWKKESAPKEKTILLLEEPDQPPKRLILTTETPAEKVEEFISQ